MSIGKVSEPQKSIILSAKHVDFWIEFPDIEETKDNEINIVTPKLIKRTIKFAISNGFGLQRNFKELKIKLENNLFEIIQ